MKQYTITAPQHFNHTVLLPSSKSISNRTLIIHALSGNKVLPKNLSNCDDTQVMLDAITHMPAVIDVKAAGTAMRFLTAYLAITPGKHVITGTERMKQRPIGILVEALRYLGAEIEYIENEGFPPLCVHGKPLEGGRLEIAGNVSSQYISALLLIAPSLKNGLELTLTGGLISSPYIDLTLWIMQQLGAKAQWIDVNMVKVEPSAYVFQSNTIESDWSAASYWYEMLALNNQTDGGFVLQGLMDGSKQGDSVLRYIFSLLGIKTMFKPATTQNICAMSIVHHVNRLPRLEYDFVNSPDLAQTFVVCCALLDVHFHFTGLESLRIKETNRIEALIKEMRKLGFVIQVRNDSELFWDGEKIEPTLEPIDTYEDHRMAMAFAPAAIKFSGLKINNPEVVSKSYPNYWNDLQRVGFTIEENEI